MESVTISKQQKKINFNKVVDRIPTKRNILCTHTIMWNSFLFKLKSIQRVAAIKCNEIIIIIMIW